MQNIKPYIALILLTVFLTKNTLVDAKLLVSFMSSNDITFVNPFCKKTQAKNSENQHFVSQDSQTTVIPFSTFCTPQFHFETLITDIPFKNQFYPDTNFISPKTYQVFKEPNFPPPKV
ncbi:hypothetical protein OS188_10100 [Xanthomarina sp. F1114]|uniref:hypothetical protein n=1 Tax=Xanthomarina sp. F1114 TaxID=2996019 RepID=UPI00225E0F30|nr:hypothetical protein [Xanthomarina sp. F1114]MCX7548302.1 hypothetical protein [Xanthomarina sp. F1114]